MLAQRLNPAHKKAFRRALNSLKYAVVTQQVSAQSYVIRMVTVTASLSVGLGQRLKAKTC